MADTSLTEPITQPFTLNQHKVLAVGRAMAQRYRIAPCALCGGPEIFSKTKPTSRCFRCWTFREHMAVKQHKTSWRRCALCEEPRMAAIPLNKRYCRECEALTQHERSKRLRWKAEKVRNMLGEASKDSMKPVIDSNETMVPSRGVAETDPESEKG